MKDENPEARFPISLSDSLRNPRLKLASFYFAAREIFFGMTLKARAKVVVDLFKQTVQEWLDDDAPQLGAAPAYYSVFSLAPMVLLLIAVIGILFRNDPVGAWSRITEQMSYFLDKSAIELVQQIARQVATPTKSALGGTIGFALALFGASGVFGQLQAALNTIWGVKAKPGRSIWRFVRSRFLSFALIAGIGFLLLVSLVIETGIKALSHYLQSVLPGALTVIVPVYLAFDFVIVTAVFTMIFKILPNATTRWRDVWIRRRSHGDFVFDREMGTRNLSRQRNRGVSLRCSQLAHHVTALDLLLVANFTFRRRVYPSLRPHMPRQHQTRQIRGRDRAQRNRKTGITYFATFIASSLARKAQGSVVSSMILGGSASASGDANISAASAA